MSKTMMDLVAFGCLVSGIKNNLLFLAKKNPLKIPSIFAIITNASMHDANIL